ncbi:MAG TPA: glycoside hydrolase 43 family protein [Opitutaceae bacterium]|nr:glycoside hydrolase 43 family protein [Opitutaceae bacterium]
MIAAPSRFAPVIVWVVVALVRTVSADAAADPWLPDSGDGTYRNPVLFADYSDPDVVRVGEDFWLVSSSFNQAPGLPILHSRDLVSWTIVNHALPALDYPDASGRSVAEHFSTPQHGAGVWAPAIRFHAGRFFIFFPDPDYGIYVTTATDPREKWSAPVLVKGGRGLIDPCPLWDDDGKVYLVHGWAKSRSGKNNQLTVNELSADATRVLDGEGTVVIDENTAGRGFNTLEGPKLYRHAGEYWIFAPVGGVTGGTQAVYRAKNIRGPYEPRLVLAQGATPINGPHQGAWVDTPAGENWFLHFQDRGAFGRVVHLEPMSWGADGWPRMGTGVATGAEKGEPVLAHEKPRASRPETVRSAAPATTDEFDSPTLGRQWQWQANPRTDWSSLGARRGFMRLAAVPLAAGGTLYDAPNLLLQKFTGPSFTATTVLDATALGENSDAGLIVFGYGYAWIGVHRDVDGVRVRYACDTNHVPRPAGAIADGAFHINVDSKARVAASKVFLRVTVAADAKCTFSFGEDGEHFTELNPGSAFQATVDRWIGAKVGLFAAAPEGKNSGSADFDWFRVTP